MKNNFFSISNHQSDYAKPKPRESNRRKIDEQWKLITGKEPIVQYQKKSKTILRKNDDMSEKISKIQNNIQILARVTESILQETKKQTLALENIAAVLKHTFGNKISPKVTVVAIDPPSSKVEPIQKVTRVEEEGLGEENSKKLYKKVETLRGNHTWKNIATLLNSENIPTLSGSSIWGPELLRYFMKKMTNRQEKYDS